MDTPAHASADALAGAQAPDEAQELRTLLEALREDVFDGLTDEAEARLEAIIQRWPFVQEDLTFPVLIAIQKGQVMEAMRYLNGLPEDQAPELRTLCLRIIGDPTWQGRAEALEASDDPLLRKVGSLMLERPEAVARARGELRWAA